MNKNKLWGKNRPKRIPVDGYEQLCSVNFSLLSIFSILKKTKLYRKSDKAYALFDKAYDVYCKRMPFHINISLFIKKGIASQLEKHYLVNSFIGVEVDYDYKRFL